MTDATQNAPTSTPNAGTVVELDEARFGAAISACGVSSSNGTTRSTAASAASTAIRSASALSGRSAPLPRRRTEASEFTATTSDAPSPRAWSR